MKKYLRFLLTADSSLAEVACHIHLAYRLDFTDKETRQRLEGTRSDAGRPVTGLVDCVRGQIDKGTAVSVPIS